jgi:DNA-binding CsgD family transcriptional regulator
VYTPVADGVYLVFQTLWIVAVAVRWRDANRSMRRQLRVLLVAVAATLVLLLVGLLVWGSPLAGLVSVGLVPVAAGYAIDGLSLAKTVETKRVAGQLEVLTPRELEVLDLMAQGLSNQAICGRLHLSIKTVEPLIGSIFLKLDLPSDGNANKRVQAVVRYLGR